MAPPPPSPSPCSFLHPFFDLFVVLSKFFGILVFSLGDFVLHSLYINKLQDFSVDLWSRWLWLTLAITSCGCLFISVDFMGFNDKSGGGKIYCYSAHITCFHCRIKSNVKTCYLLLL